MLNKKDKKEAKRFAVVARYIYSHSDDSYSELKVFEIRSHAIEYMDAMNTAAKYSESKIEYILFVLEPAPNPISN